MKKKNIAFFITHPIPYLSPLFRKLSKNNEINLTVYYFSEECVEEFHDKDFGLMKWDVDLLNGYECKFIKNNSPFPAISNVPFGLINFKIINEIKNNDYDFIVVQGWNYISHWIVFLTSFMLRVPVLLRTEMPYNQELLKNKLKLIVKKIILKPLFKRISIFLAIGKQNSDFYKFHGVPDKKIIFSPYAIDNNFFRSRYIKLKDEKEELKRQYKLNKYKNIVLFVGRLTIKKKPLDLIKAFQKISDKNSCLILVGGGNLRKGLEQYVRNNNISNIFFIGFVNQDELPNFYTMADLFVLPSGLGETWGLVINEAMNYNLPIIASNTVGSCDDLILDNGLTFEVGDINDLSIKIKDTLSNSNLKHMGEMSHKIIQRYSYQAIEKSVIEAINRSKK